jgi:hypothetical protein
MLAAMTASQIAFYATVGTVIPVLFLAIGVQRDGLYQFLLRAIAGADSRERNTPPRGLGRIAASVPALVVLSMTAGAFLAILVFAAYAEALAIYALYQGHASHITAVRVLIATIAMIIITAALPALLTLQTLTAVLRRAFRQISTHRPPGYADSSEGPPRDITAYPAAVSDDPPPAVSDETDTEDED